MFSGSLQVLSCGFVAIVALPGYVLARPFDPSTYLMTATVRTIEVHGTSDRLEGGQINVLIAVTAGRALIGWGSMEAGQYRERFRLAGDAAGSAVGFSFSAKKGPGMLASEDRAVDEISLQSTKFSDDTRSRLAAIEIAAFSDFTFPLLFRSDYVGVDYDDIAAQVESPRPRPAIFPCGKLVVTGNGALRSIQFSQGVGDLLTSRIPGRTLGDATNDAFPHGLERVQQSCTFDPPLTEGAKAPWRVDAQMIREGRDGRREHVRYLLDVDFFSIDVSRINAEIDNILDAIPRGESVSTNEPIEYMWNGRAVERRIDEAALEVADQLQFQRTRGVFHTVAVATLSLLVIAVGAVLSARWYRSRRK